MVDHQPSYPNNTPPPWRRCAVSIGVALTLAITARALAAAPKWVEQYYADGIAAWTTRGLSSLTGPAPFSVVELLIGLSLSWLIAPVIPTVYRIACRKRTLGNALACGAARTLGLAGLLVSTFYLLWGFNYARAPLPARLQWNDAGLAALPWMGGQENRNELAGLCLQLTFLANHYYEVATGRPNALEKSDLPVGLPRLDRFLEDGYARVARELDLPASFAAPRGPAKPIAMSRLMSRLGILGFYSPWTGEANFNAETPPFELPMTIAHEKAHQRCIASEDEANFNGFLACVSSDDPYSRYAGYLFAQRQLLRELSRIDPVAARAIIRLRCKGVQSDVIYGRFFNRIMGGPAQSFGNAVNNAYLKANRIGSGVMSYRLSSRLLILFSRQNGRSLLVTPRPVQQESE